MTDKETFIQLLLQTIIERITALPPGIRYTAETLCGPEIWGSFSPSECKRTGRLIAEFTKQGKLQLHRLPNASNNSAQYELLAQ